MDPFEQDQLVRLLGALAEEGRALPHMPQAVFGVIGRVAPLVAVEIGLTRDRSREALRGEPNRPCPARRGFYYRADMHRLESLLGRHLPWRWLNA